MNYSKDQLIQAMHQYNIDYLENPDNYDNQDDSDLASIEVATRQVERLISFIEK